MADYWDVQDLMKRVGELEQSKLEQDERIARVEQATEPIELKIVRGLPLPEATLLQNIMDQVGRQGPDIAQNAVDIAAMKTDISTINRQLEEHGMMLEEILRRLPEQKGE